MCPPDPRVSLRENSCLLRPAPTPPAGVTFTSARDSKRPRRAAGYGVDSVHAVAEITGSATIIAAGIVLPSAETL